MRYIVLFILLFLICSHSRSQDVNGSIAQAHQLLAPTTRLAVDGSGILTMDHLVEGEVRQRHRVNGEDLDPEGTALDTAQQSIVLRCKALRPRCFTTINYAIDLEKRSSQGSVHVGGGAQELTSAGEVLTALIKGLAEEFGSNETSLLMMRRNVADHIPGP
jgi:hypothetical protein